MAADGLMQLILFLACAHELTADRSNNYVQQQPRTTANQMLHMEKLMAVKQRFYNSYNVFTFRVPDDWDDFALSSDSNGCTFDMLLVMNNNE